MIINIVNKRFRMSEVTLHGLVGFATTMVLVHTHDMGSQRLRKRVVVHHLLAFLDRTFQSIIQTTNKDAIYATDGGRTTSYCLHYRRCHHGVYCTSDPKKYGVQINEQHHCGILAERIPHLFVRSELPFFVKEGAENFNTLPSFLPTLLRNLIRINTS